MMKPNQNPVKLSARANLQDEQGANSRELILLRGDEGPKGVGGEAEGGGCVGRPLHRHLPASDVSRQTIPMLSFVYLSVHIFNKNHFTSRLCLFTSVAAAVVF